MKDKKNDLYRVERFSVEQLHKLQFSIRENSVAINGLPQNADEVYQKRGWLIVFLLAYDDLLWQRWDYWTTILEKGTIEGSGPIPKINWVHKAESKSIATMKMLTECLNHHEANMDLFADWLLWGLAATDVMPRISKKLNQHFYQVFDLFLILDNPTDYLSDLLCDQTGKGYKQGLGYYPTPMDISVFMTEIVRGDQDPEALKKLTVMDSCVGCGAMLLPASNYFLRAYAQDISLIATKLCRIQMYFYAPWYAIPGENIKGFNQNAEPLSLVLSPNTKLAAAGQLAFSF
ncbi:type I restriction-modification system subunit M [Paenibacillus tepidiphilus]|uniref:type I restriction-modification system subunit M n=1 Tax=Paenibacillus tepidiphilus TaxID=2608683 RepID=UPI00123B43AF|nr:type I restriction-modification system subunit M [Paenibacillus tepidiphilus]